MRHVTKTVSAAFLTLALALGTGGIARAATSPAHAPFASTTHGHATHATKGWNVPSQRRVAAASTTPATADADRYAQREARAPQLQKFRGGSGVSIYIGGSAVAVALVIVLAIIIL